MSTAGVRLRCPCGGSTSWSAVQSQVWECPACARRWEPEAAAQRQVIEGIAGLARLRQLLLAAAAVAALAVVVLAIVAPRYLLGVPVLVGGVLLALQPTYNKHRNRALKDLAVAIPLRQIETFT